MTHTPIINFDLKLFTDSWSDESNSQKRPQKSSVPKEQPPLLVRHTQWDDDSDTEYWRGKNNAQHKINDKNEQIDKYINFFVNLKDSPRTLSTEALPEVDSSKTILKFHKMLIDWSISSLLIYYHW